MLGVPLHPGVGLGLCIRGSGWPTRAAPVLAWPSLRNGCEMRIYCVTGRFVRDGPLDRVARAWHRDAPARERAGRSVEETG